MLDRSRAGAILGAMPKRSRKPNQDVNQIGASATGASQRGRAKNPAAVALGRLGGLKGGPARARALSSKRKRAIAQNAAAARWKRRGA